MGSWLTEQRVVTTPEPRLQDLVTQLITERSETLRKWFARRLPAALDPAADPDDLVQETSMRAWLGAGRLRSDHPGSMWAWIMKIAERVLLEAIRSAQAHGQTSRPAGAQVHVVALTQVLRIAGPPNAAGAEFERVQRALAVAFNALTPNRRLVLELHYVDGLSYKQIAQRLNKSERAVRDLVRFGREQLRQRFARAFKRLGRS